MGLVSMMKRQLQGELTHQVSLSGLTTWRVGGLAERLYRPVSIDDLTLFLEDLDTDEPLLFIGLGSNLLVRDGGFSGTVIHCFGGMDGYHIDEQPAIYCECGVTSARVARLTARAGLAGAGFLSGIPGTIGGALAMNAGCYGGEIWNLIDWVETIDHRGVVRRRERSEFRVGYRSVTMPAQEWFVGARLLLKKGNAAELQMRNRQLLTERQQSQPTREATAGSVFRNPEGDYAARLIEACGLKGYRIGGAEISKKHANFIINSGSARATDIEELIQTIQERVEMETGVLLQPEVKIVGVAANE